MTLLEKQLKIGSLIASLTSTSSNIGDWKIIKCYEYSLEGKELPYDISSLAAARQEVRDEINKLQQEIADGNYDKEVTDNDTNERNRLYT